MSVSSALNIGGQNNGKQSVSGVGNDQNLTGNNSIQDNNNNAAAGRVREEQRKFDQSQRQ